MHTCVFVCMHTCPCVRMCMCTYLGMYICCSYVYTHVCMCVYKDKNMCVYMCIYIHIRIVKRLGMCRYIDMCIVSLATKCDLYSY